MNETTINKLLLASLQLEKVLTHLGMEKSASMVRQMTSQRIMRMAATTQMSYHVLCSCGKWLRDSKEIAFYKHNAMCYSCESGYQDDLEERIRDLLYETS